MRKLLLILAVFLSAVGFTTHAQNEEVTVAKILETVTADHPVEVKFRAGRTSNNNFYYLGVVGTGSTVKDNQTVKTTTDEYTLVATSVIDNNTTWYIELGPEPADGAQQTYYVKNKELSKEGKAIYLGRTSANLTPSNDVYDYNGSSIIVTGFTLEDGNLPSGETPMTYVIETYTGGDEAANGLTVKGITARLKPSDGGVNSFLNAYGGVTGTNVCIKGHKPEDGGSSWDILTDLTAAAKEDFANECDSYLALVNYLAGKTGLLEDGVATTATEAITAAKTKIDTDFAGAKADAQAAMTNLYKGIRSINVLLKSNNNLYLANHRSVEAVDGSHPTRVHAHERFGFASVWQLSYDDGTTDVDGDGVNDIKEGLHIKSYYRGENDGIGDNGSSLDDDGFYLSFATLLDNKSNPYSGVIIINNDGWFLSDNKAVAGDDETVLEEVNSKSTLWDIEPVAMPKTLSMDNATLTVTMGQTDVNVLSEANPIIFTSNKDGVAVPDELKGLAWTIEDESIATITPTEKFDQYQMVDENGKVEDGYNGYGNATITPLKEGETKIIATSVISETIVGNTGVDNVGTIDEVPSCVITLIVKKAPLTSIAASHADATIAGDAEGDARNVEVTITTEPAGYDLTAGKLTAALTQTDAEDIDIEIEPKTTSATEGQQLAVENADEENTDETPAATSAVYVAKIPVTVAPGTYKLKVDYNESVEGEDAVSESHTVSDATITVDKILLKSLTASIPANTTITTTATGDARKVELTVVPTPDTYVVEASQLTVMIGEEKCDVTAAPAVGEGDDAVAPANKFTVTIPADVAAGQQTLAVSFKETAETANAIDATVTADGTLTLTIATPAITGISYQDANGKELTDNAVAIKVPAGEGKTISQDIVIVAAPQGAVFTGKKVNWAVTKDDAESTDVTIAAKTVENEAANQLTFTITASVAGTYTLTPSIDGMADLTLQPLTVIVTKADKALVVSTIEAAPVADVTLTQTGEETFTATGEATFTVTLGENSEALAKGNLNVTYNDVTIGEITLSKNTETEYTVTVPFTATAPTADGEKASVTLTITGTSAETDPAETASFAVVKPALAIESITPPAETAEVKVDDNDLKAEFTVTVATGSAWPTAADFTATATVVEAGEISVTSTSATEFTVTVPYTAETAGDATIVLTSGKGEAAKTATANITVKGEEPTPDDPTPGEAISDELPVTAPENDADNIAAPVVNVTEDKDGNPEVAIDLNASPAAEGGAEVPEAILTVTLPKTEKGIINPEAFQQPEVIIVKGDQSSKVTADITADGVTINASGAKIGDIIKIIIRKATIALDQQALAPSALLLDEPTEGGSNGEETEGEIVMTIDVTIYGVEFTKAPSTATLGMDNTVNVTFETNACVPAAKEDAPEESSDETEAAEEEAPAVTLSVDGEGAEVDNKTGVITFTKAGTYKVTAKAGDNYAATTTITVKEAPTVTGIEAVNADAAAGNATVYDLHGRRLNRVNAAGVYIVNGVKTLVR